MPKRFPSGMKHKNCASIFDLNPLGVIASGALLIAVARDSAPAVCQALHEIGIPAAAIATAVPAGRGLTLHTADGIQPLPRFDQDEITRLF